MQRFEITEIFHSIQGESTYTGLPCVFVRLSGCNLRCSYCDTEYSHEKGEIMTIEEILHKIDSYKCGLVELTGGEPLFQHGTQDLVSSLLSKGYKVLMETNGSLDIDLVDRRCVRIVDVKCPSSGMSEKNNFANMNRLTEKDQLKFVISDKIDFNYMAAILNKYNPQLQYGSILAAPVAGILKPAQLASWILESNMEIRMQLQLHRQIWPDIDRGV